MRNRYLTNEEHVGPHGEEGWIRVFSDKAPTLLTAPTLIMLNHVSLALCKQTLWVV
jgi:hypothetical protein